MSSMEYDITLYIYCYFMLFMWRIYVLCHKPAKSWMSWMSWMASKLLLAFCHLFLGQSHLIQLSKKSAGDLKDLKTMRRPATKVPLGSLGGFLFKHRASP